MLAVMKKRTNANVKMHEIIVSFLFKDRDENQGLKNTGVGSL
jgi:hypothetical protein